MTADATLVRRWPKDLVGRIRERDYVLVVGSGASAACRNKCMESPPSWGPLLQKLIKEFLSGVASKEASRLVKENNFLDAAELIKSEAEERGKGKDFVRYISESVDGKKPENFLPAPIHDTLLRLDPRIIVTTNYDSILERASSNGYRVKTYDSSDIGHEVRTGAPLLLKIHGSVDAELDLVLTRSDYSRLRRNGRAALAVLEALFLTRTTLFVGYSLSDPDILLLLENNMGREANSGAHYMLTGNSVPEHRRRALVRSYGVELITYKSDDYGEANRMLELLADMVAVS